MARKTALAICVAMLAIGVPPPAAAQDAAESALIVGGVGQGQAKAQRSLGTAITNSINSASNSVRASTSPAPMRSRRQARNARGPVHIAAGVDPLEGTDAQSYHLDNGASIRVSGGLRPPPKPACAKDCPGDEKQP